MKSPILALGCALLALTSIVRSAESAKPAFLDCYVSTGDNHFLGSSLPIDSPASIEATFDLFKNVNRVRRVYWRGLEEASWLATMQARPENPRYHSLWTWLEQLYAEVQPDQLAVKAAHARGMEIWGVGSLWDWGAQADTPTFGDYPFPFESKLRLAHPEWAPANKFGTRRQGGPIELAYPEARRALVELTVKETLKAGYDGITFLTYVENYSMRYQDEFGYSEPIVRDFKKLHGIDITKEPFKRGATREDWLRLRGRYITAFLRELRAALQPHDVKLGMIINGNDPHSPLTWNVPEIMMTAGAHHLDIETWVREGLVDALCVYGNVAPGAQEKTLADLRFLSRGTDVEVSFMTSGPFAERWNAAHQERVPCVLAISDDTQHLARGYVAVQTAEALRSADLWSRLRALGQIIDGELVAPPAEIIPLAKSANLIERRMALQALGKTGAKLAEAVLPTLTAALDDPENGVRCMAALALGQVRDPRSAAALLSAVEKRGNHMLMECAVIALRRLQPLPAADLAKSLTAHASGRVRQAAIRSLMPFGPKDQLPAFSSALDDSDRFTRFAAAEALGNIGKSPDAANRLLLALDHADPAVANRAAVSLGVIALRREPELTALRSKMLAALEARFQQYARPQPPADADWGYRPVGNALLDFGDEGGAVLKKLRAQRENPALAELAWRVLDLRQAKNTFSEADPQSDEAAHARRPMAAAPEPARSLRVDPVGGNDAHDGRTQPVKTIARAIKLAQPGDTIHLAPARYRESADLSNKRGEPGRPIILDGHGAVLDGAESLRPEDWPMVAPGLYRCDRLTTINGAILGRWFFVFDGKMSHMGRTSKGPSAALKSPEELAPGEWTYVPDAPITRETKDGKPWDSVPRAGAFYVKIDPAKSLAEARIEAPIRSSGVVLSGKSAHLVIRNVIAKVKAEFGDEMLIAMRLGCFDSVPYRKNEATTLGEPLPYETPYPYGWGVNPDDPLSEDLTEVKQAIGWFKDWGVQLLNVSIGCPYYNPHIGRPFEKPDEGNYEMPEHPLLGVDRHFRISGELQQAFPDLPMVGTGYSWLQIYALNAAAHNIEQGRIRIFGLGRGTLSYPDFAVDALEKGALDEIRVCKTLTYCTFLMRQKNHPLGQFPAGCPPFDKLVYGPIMKQAREAFRSQK